MIQRVLNGFHLWIQIEWFYLVSMRLFMIILTVTPVHPNTLILYTLQNNALTAIARVFHSDACNVRMPLH